MPRDQNEQNIESRDMNQFYSRQRLLAADGWSQDSLENSHITFLGTGIIPQFVQLGCSQLGFGNIKYFSNSSLVRPNYGEFLFFGENQTDSKSKELADMLRQVNPFIDITGINHDFSTLNEMNMIGTPDVIIETSNDSRKKQLAFEYSDKIFLDLQRIIPIVCLAGSRDSAKIGAYYPGKNLDKEKLSFQEYDCTHQGFETSCLIAGLGVREITGIVMPRENEQALDHIIAYDLNFPIRVLHFPCEIGEGEDLVKYNLALQREFNREISSAAIKKVLTNFLSIYADKSKLSTEQRKPKLKAIHAIIEGVGALGNPTSLYATIANFAKVTLADYDTIEESNKSRQFGFCFGDTNNRLKIDVMKEVLEKIKTAQQLGSEFECIPRGVTLEFEEYIKQNNPDIMYLCFDNFPAEALANYYSFKHNIPLISGGVEKDISGRVAVYVPGKNACLQHQVGIDEAAIRHARIQAQTQSCQHAPTPSVVTNNMIIAGIMMCETESILNGKPVEGIIKYASRSRSRLGVMPSVSFCDCYKNGESEWLEKMKDVY